MFKAGENVSNYTKTDIITDKKKLKRLVESPLSKQISFLESESGERGLHEVVSEQRKITDRKPVHIAVCILQNSKLMLLKFVDFLRTYLEEGSYSLVYGGSNIFNYK